MFADGFEGPFQVLFLFAGGFERRASVLAVLFWKGVEQLLSELCFIGKVELKEGC